MTYRRHGSEEILAKLHQAEQMAAEGKHQRDIASALNVSVMTYHRWRKAAGVARRAIRNGELAQQQKIEQLQVENGRLRKLVADLLLEKVRLEEELPAAARDSQGGHASV